MDRTSTVGTVKTLLFFRNLSSKSECCNMKSWHHFFIYWPTFPSVISYTGGIYIHPLISLLSLLSCKDLCNSLTLFFFFAYLSATIPINHEAKKCLQSSAYLNFIIAASLCHFYHTWMIRYSTIYMHFQIIWSREHSKIKHPCFSNGRLTRKIGPDQYNFRFCRRTVTTSRVNWLNSQFFVGILWIYKVNHYFDVPYF